MPLTVGELARRCGLTVRTLHHYDAIGLLKPSLRSDAGYRLYDRDSVERLHRIQAPRQLGLPLADIGTVLSGPGSRWAISSIGRSPSSTTSSIGPPACADGCSRCVGSCPPDSLPTWPNGWTRWN